MSPFPLLLQVRSRTYLADKKKQASLEPAFALETLDLFQVAAPTWHVARFLPNVQAGRSPFYFVLQVMVPGRHQHLCLTLAWACSHTPLLDGTPRSTADSAFDEAQSGPSTRNRLGGPGKSPEGAPPGGALPVGHPSDDRTRAAAAGLPASAHEGKAGADRGQVAAGAAGERGEDSPGEDGQGGSDDAAFDAVLRRFLSGAGDDPDAVARRHGMFKLIPRIENGNWLIRQSVGQNTPVLLGKKLATRYHKGPNYMEVDIDVGSSAAAAYTVGLVQGALRSLVIDMAVILEGKTEADLPERLLGTVRLHNLDLGQAAFLDVTTGRIYRSNDPDHPLASSKCKRSGSTRAQ